MCVCVRYVRVCMSMCVRARVCVCVCVGWEHSMAVTANGTLYTWGGGYEGSRPVCGHGSLEVCVCVLLVQLCY